MDKTQSQMINIVKNLDEFSYPEFPAIGVVFADVDAYLIIHSFGIVSFCWFDECNRVHSNTLSCVDEPLKQKYSNHLQLESLTGRVLSTFLVDNYPYEVTRLT